VTDVHQEHLSGAAAEPDATLSRRRRRLDPRIKRVLQILVSVALVGLIVRFVFGQFANLSQVTDVLRTLTWGDVTVLVLVAIWNLLTYWVVVVVATPGMTVAQAGVLTQSTTAVSNAIPGGGAIAVGLTYTTMSSWGFSRSRATMSVVVTGIWNSFIKLGMPILALALLALQGRSGAGRTFAAVLGLAGLVAAVMVFALVLRSQAFAARTGIGAGLLASRLLAVVKRQPVHGWDLAVVKWRSRVIGLVRHRWLALSVSTVVSHVSLFVVLLVALRITGVPAADVGWAEALAVFAFARLVTAIPVTPGGVGVVELALIAGLTQAGGADANIVAAVLLFRLLTYVLPIVVGALTYIYWRNNTSWRDSAPPLNDPELTTSESDSEPATL
jgi:putative heme transporter